MKLLFSCPRCPICGARLVYDSNYGEVCRYRHDWYHTQARKPKTRDTIADVNKVASKRIRGIS